MKTLVTGATGFIGARLVRALSERGDEVRALVLPGEDYSHIAAYVAEAREGDITDLSALGNVGEGIDVVYHLAARVIDHGSRDEFYKPILNGTRNMLEACAGAAGRFVFASSICACGTGRHMKGMNEGDPCVKTGIHYGDAKLEAEGLVRRSADRFRDGFVIVRPANVIGPRSTWVVELGSRIRDGFFAYFDRGRHSASLIHVDSLVDGFLLCGTKKEAAGQTYFLRDDWEVSWKQYLDDVAAMFDERITLSVPHGLAWFLASVEEKLAARGNRRPWITRHTLGLMGRDNDVDTTRAKNELGWRTKVPYEEAMEDIRAWVKRSMWTKSIDDKVLIITGGSSGLGKALAERLITRSTSLALVARDAGKLRAVREQLERQDHKGGRVEVFPCDVSQAEAVDKTFKEIAEKLGPPDILINSAGILREGYFERQALEGFREVMNINFFGTVYCIRAVLPFFKKKGGGRVVNISSMAGLLGTFGYTSYCSSKHAMVGLTHTLRAELKPQHVSFNLVCPTEFETPMVDELNKTRSPENKAMIHLIPMSTVDEVADAVIRGMEKDQYLVIPGLMTRITERANRWFPGLTRLMVDSKIAKAYRGPGSTH